MTVPYFLWNKAFRSILFDGKYIVFDEKKDLFEDCALTFSLFLKANSFYLSDKAYYCYVLDNPKSATSEPRTDRAYYHLAMYAAQRFYMENNGQEYLPQWKKAWARHISFLAFDSIIDSKHGKSHFFKYLKEYKKLRKEKPELEGQSYEDLVKRTIK